MEIKHTIEILTKDIQDIENLVRNLNNYTSPPRIEIDLAMAKLRNVYELLAMISADIKSDMEEAALRRETGAEPSTHAQGSLLTDKRPGEVSYGSSLTEKKPGEVSDRASLTENRTEEISEGSPLPEEKPEKSKEVIEATRKKEVIEEKEVKEEKQQPSAEDLQTRVEPPKESSAPQASKEVNAPGQQVDAPGQQGVPVPEKFKEEIKKASIIAEKFAANKSINERIVPGSSKDVSSRLTGEPIDSIKRNIGINDRFLIIRELLNGDNEGYNQIVQQLDACANFDQAHGLIEQSFPNKMEHEGVDILVKLSRRRFLSKNG